MLDIFGRGGDGLKVSSSSFSPPRKRSLTPPLSLSLSLSLSLFSPYPIPPYRGNSILSTRKIRRTEQRQITKFTSSSISRALKSLARSSSCGSFDYLSSHPPTQPPTDPMGRTIPLLMSRASHYFLESSTRIATNRSRSFDVLDRSSASLSTTTMFTRTYKFEMSRGTKITLNPIAVLNNPITRGVDVRELRRLSKVDVENGRRMVGGGGGGWRRRMAARRRGC
jgi:hypothetical protein